MTDELRWTLATFIVRHLRRPRALVIRAWFWLAAQTDDLEKKRRCLSAILELDLEDEPASLALPVLDQRRAES
jgi:hypothetical protein